MMNSQAMQMVPDVPAAIVQSMDPAGDRAAREEEFILRACLVKDAALEELKGENLVHLEELVRLLATDLAYLRSYPGAAAP